MKGGRYIGSGSDGCVFNVRFDETGKVIPGSEDGAMRIASKVYVTGPGGTLNTQAVNEYDIMMKVRKITNARGVVVALDNTLRQIPDIDPVERDTISKPTKGACAQLTDENKPYTVMDLPLVAGNINPYGGPYTESTFSELEFAVNALKEAKLTQLDLAGRNIFYDEIGGEIKFLLGDFGNGIDLSSDDPRELRKGFLRLIKHYKTTPITLVYRDGFHYRGYLYLVALAYCMVAKSKGDGAKARWEQGLKEFAQFKAGFRGTVDKNLWRIKTLLDTFAPPIVRIDEAELKAEFEALDVGDLPAQVEGGPGEPVQVEEDYLPKREEFLKKWLDGIDATLDEILQIQYEDGTLDMLTMKAKEEVLKSDGLMYEFLRAVHIDGPVAGRLTRLIEKWFPVAPVGARRRTYRRKRVKMSRKRVNGR